MTAGWSQILRRRTAVIRTWASGVTIAAAVAACSSASSELAPPPVPSPTPEDAGAAAVSSSPLDVFDVPISGISDDERKQFVTGDRLFELPLRAADGLGPLYTRASCASCHASGVRGPGSVQKMAVVLDDGVTRSPDQSALPFGSTTRPLKTAGATRSILPPDDPGVNVKVTTRVGPSILGRGYIEAILDSEIERVAAEQASRGDGIHGRINHVRYASENNSELRFQGPSKGDLVIGRFGFKARIATLDDFTADALQGDMGITSPLRPTELPNPDGLTDDAKPGVDVTLPSVEARAMYVRLTAIPPRSLDEAGRALFERAQCAVCHIPALKTRPDFPIAVLAGIDAPIYSDLLVHDMGAALADGVEEGEARSRDWRTAPLIGLRHNRTFLHDSRASTIEEAILMHGAPDSEAAESIRLYSNLNPQERATLLAFVSAL